MMRRNWFGKGICFLVGALMLTLLMATCAFAAPVIEKYAVSATTVQAGQTVKLSWKVTGASEVAIYGIEKDTELQAEGSLEVWPLASTSYVLIAYGTDGTVTSKSLTVNVDAKQSSAKIDYYKATPTQVQAGQTVNLSWKVTNGKSTRIVGIDSDNQKTSELTLPITGNVEVWPLVTTTYLLEATGLNGEIVSSALTINVVKAPTVKPEILTFTASKTTVRSGELVTLSWTTKNATTCTLETSTGKKITGRPTNGSLSVAVSSTMTFTLTALDAKGQTAVSKVTVTVK